MTILDNLPQIKKLDQQNVYGSIENLAKQCSHAWEDCKNIKVSDDYQNINKIVMTGMGGSGLGARVIESVFGLELKMPLIRINDYDLPDWVDNKTLVICSSYSGTTEEIVSTAKQAEAKKTKWMTICAGGKLLEMAQKNKVPAYKIDPIYNPSNQPRMAIGYSIIGQLALVSKTGIINISQQDIDNITLIMQQVIEENNIKIPFEQNPAKKMAKTIFQKQVIIVPARHLKGAVHTFKNQMNENAKNLSHRHDIPELNHHLMEGLKFPKNNKQDLVFLFINSSLYPKRIQQRFKITDDVVKKNKIKTLSWKATAKDKLSQTFQFIQFGAFVNFYLAMLYSINPAPVPWVDYFKIKLGQPLGK